MTHRLPLKPLPAEDWDESVFRVRDGMRGRPLSVHGLMAHNPALLAAWWDFRMHVVRGGGLTDRRRSLRIRTPSSCSSGVSPRIRSENMPISAATSSGERDQFSVENE